jgi:Zn-dependent protease/CBS domain-containing protein
VYVGRPFGIPVYFDLTWILLAVYITVAYAPSFSHNGESPGPRSYSLAFLVALLFAFSVLAHELSHSVIARLMGLPVRRITILFFGGVSEISRDPETAARTYLVSVAGPLMSLMLSAIAFMVLMLAALQDTVHYVVTIFATVNGLVAIVNLLPGLPLDGGHVLRAIVWQVTGSPDKGTFAAAWTGRWLAAGIVATGLVVAGVPAWHQVSGLTLFMAALLGIYLWQGASVELRQAELHRILPTLDLRRLVRRAIAVTADTPLAEAVRRARTTGARALVVVDHQGNPEGLVQETKVMATAPQRQPWVTVGALSRALGKGLVLEAGLTGEPLLEALRVTPATEYLVVEPDGRVLGVLVAADLVKALQPG